MIVLYNQGHANNYDIMKYVVLYVTYDVEISSIKSFCTIICI